MTYIDALVYGLAVYDYTVDYCVENTLWSGKMVLGA
jgi:hypothetical protein